jgi:hypothetical protein
VEYGAKRVIASVIGLRVVLKQIPYRLLLVHHDVQVRAGHGHVRVTRGGPDFRQRSPARQGVTDERVPAVVNGQGLMSAA